MAKIFSSTVFSVLISALCIIFCCAFADDKQEYIVYMGSLPKNNYYSPLDNHNSILQEVLENSFPSDSLIRSYGKSFNGFVASLTEKERQKLASKAGIVSIFPNKKYQLLTTRSWDFMGFTEDVKRAPQVESDVIVGVIDSGIDPESESFSDEGFGAPPKKWNGVCKGGEGFKCNNKLIGARFYGNSNDARDNVGHGTHTASTAAGNQVNNVSFFGFAPGNARGAVPSARIAVYKVCGGASDCSGASILAAFDDAISDNVDILSVSLGGEGTSMYLADPIAIGSFHAMQKGILTSQAAGNSGPDHSTVTSIAPWLLAVAASTTDRKIITKIILGDNTTLVGRAINSFNRTKRVSLVDRKSPFRESLTSVYNSYENNIVVFNSMGQGDLESAVDSNATGFISLYDRGMKNSRIVPLPGALLNSSDAEILRSYKEEASNPMATILRSEALKDATAPVIAVFSSRGPSAYEQDLLKPDITAPGVEIIAAWAPKVPPSDGDKRSVKYSILSGTSMACPHVTGAAAYVKSFHPDWSPSAIQSALMTTAFPLNATQNSDAELAYGAGHIDPVKAVNPGLVYEATDVDYIAMLCNTYTSYEIRQLDNNASCSEELVLVKDLNYASLATFSMANFSGEVTFKRTVTNVGVAKSSYKVAIHAGSNLNISVEPEVLLFKSLNEKKSFTVTVSTKGEVDGFISSGSIVWSDGVHKVYIVYMGALPKSDYSPLTHHHSLLQEVLENSLPSDALIYSYKRSFNGFAANLTEKESQKLSGMEGILSVFLSRKLELQTTRSWDFMGFKENVKRSPMVESNVIVGFIDTGIWPEAESFSDQGFGPPPKKWKGTCKGGENFTCNNKLIGARFYTHAIDENHNSARDTEGHGTHTASTAAGNQVNKASFYGLAPGNIRGAVPSARIAVYKVCWEDSCEDSEVLAAFDDAIADGVDIISISIGSRIAHHYYSDPIAIGSFHAMQKGVLTSQSAGNSGPYESTVTSIAPWKLSVAASTTDRQFIVKVVLGDNTTLVGKGISPFDMKGEKFPLINYHAVTNSFTGKIIFKDFYASGEYELQDKAAGIIFGSDVDIGFSSNYPLPGSLLSSKDGERVTSYINTTRHPVAEILKTDAIRNGSAPVVGSFSSRGPHPFTKDILKPDITAPGVDILAAWSPEGSPSSVTGDERSTKYNIVSGTSMACPHATGAAAYVKTFHPNWSPAAIKSALMTTAFPMNATTNPDAEFAYGSGHIEPVKAINPGLVYEALEDDYIKMLCNIGYTPEQIRIFSGHNNSCSMLSKGSPKDLNYPTMISDVAEAKFTRTVTNVGTANSTYRATITSPSNLKISVTPEVLSFKSLNETKSFVVTMSTKARREGSYHILSASLVWSDGVHNVRSPIVTYLTA